MAKKSAGTTYFTIGRDAKSGAFEVRKTGQGTTHVMGKSVFDRAIRDADGKFREVSRHPDRAPARGTWEKVK